MTGRRKTTGFLIFWLLLSSACAVEQEQADVSVKHEDVVSKTVDELPAQGTTAVVEQNSAVVRHMIRAGTARFTPLVLFIQPGELVCWSNMLTHDSQSIPGLIPEKAEAWQTPLDKDMCLPFSEEGVYIYKCNPHYALGMAGAIIVGEAVNLAEIEKRVQGKAKRIVNKVKQALAAGANNEHT